MAEIRLHHDEVFTMGAQMQHVIEYLEEREEYHLVMILDAIANTLLRRLFGGEATDQ